jgi:hypothetical protein
MDGISTKLESTSSWMVKGVSEIISESKVNSLGGPRKAICRI